MPCWSRMCFLSESIFLRRLSHSSHSSNIVMEACTFLMCRARLCLWIRFRQCGHEEYRPATNAQSRVKRWELEWTFYSVVGWGITHTVALRVVGHFHHKMYHRFKLSVHMNKKVKQILVSCMENISTVPESYTSIVQPRYPTASATKEKEKNWPRVDGIFLYFSLVSSRQKTSVVSWSRQFILW